MGTGVVTNVSSRTALLEDFQDGSLLELGGRGIDDRPHSPSGSPLTPNGFSQVRFRHFQLQNWGLFSLVFSNLNFLRPVNEGLSDSAYKLLHTGFLRSRPRAA